MKLQNDSKINKLREAVIGGELVSDRIDEMTDRIHVHEKDEVEIVLAFDEGGGFEV
ncbi:MAG: hypothetical protein Q4A78_00900 [Peptostreptococcaceae bacterium]|nr:hypothetical protein [Peptostreptococcaceae bacterium]